jgi:hypothetical protein
MDTLKNIGIVILVLLGIGLVLFLAGKQMESQERTIRDWCQGQGYEVIELEHCSFDHGPFWFSDEDQHIYRTVVVDRFENRKFIWHRSPLGWGDWDHEEYKR